MNSSLSIIGSHCPALDIDPFSTGFLTDPYSYHPLLRKAGPVVRLTRYDIYALARYNEVKPHSTTGKLFVRAEAVASAISKRKDPGAHRVSFSRPIHRCIPALAGCCQRYCPGSHSNS